MKKNGYRAEQLDKCRACNAPVLPGWHREHLLERHSWLGLLIRFAPVLLRLFYKLGKGA